MIEMQNSVLIELLVRATFLPSPLLSSLFTRSWICQKSPRFRWRWNDPPRRPREGGEGGWGFLLLVRDKPIFPAKRSSSLPLLAKGTPARQPDN